MTDTDQHETLSHQTHDQTAKQPQDSHDEPLDIWSDWIKQATEAGSNLAELFSLEIKLAVSDAGRMLCLLLLALPIALLAWLSLSGLLAWIVVDYSSSVTLGLAAFLLLQLGVLLSLRLLWKRYKRSLSLPLTREHLQSFMGGAQTANLQTEKVPTGDSPRNETRTSGT